VGDIIRGISIKFVFLFQILRLMEQNYSIVTVRNSSTRLPNKAILEVIPNLKTIEAVIQRALLTGFPVILATSTNTSDNIFETIAARNNILFFRGALFNKIKRWKDCFDMFNIDNALLVDGDDLMYDYHIGIRAMEQLENTDSLMIKHPDNIICGYFTYAIKKQGIASLYNFANEDITNTDVISEYIIKSGIKTEEIELKEWEKDKPYRLTLDYIEDLDFFTGLIKAVGISTETKKITEFLDLHPEIVNINIHRQKDWADNQISFNESVRNKINYQ